MTECFAQVETELSKNVRIKDMDKVDEKMYQMAPFVSKTLWTHLGDAISKGAERIPGYNVSGEKWISLRLDGSGFSKLLKVLRNKGIFNKGYSPYFANIMKTCVVALMNKVNGKYGYTQSDEMTILIKP